MSPPKKAKKKAFSIPHYNLRPRITRLRSGMRNIKQGINRPSVRRTHRVSRNKRPASSRNDNGSNDAIKCAICLDTERTRAMESIPCGHSFHAKCCEKWLSRSAACPVCRTPVVVLPVVSDSSSSRRVRHRRRRRHVLIRQRFEDMFLSSANIIIIDVWRRRSWPPSR